MPNFLQARQNMIDSQLKPWGILNPALLNIIFHLPREKFVPTDYQALAYSDSSLPLLHDQKMLPPKTLARAIQALTIQSADTVLEIGTGSGYSTLILSRLCKHLTSIEVIPDILELAKKNLGAFSPHNVDLILGNGALGYLDSPTKTFNKIFVAGSYSTAIPKSLIDQLNPEGKLFAFIGEAPIQEAVLISKLSDGTLSQQFLFETAVMPLIDAPKQSRFKF